ncbi:MAG: hypothetical protein JWN31_155 [Frankiales bacterium]|nr:hypothetical protein [Frankiales bacterium]
MPAILAYVALRLGLVLADPRKSVRHLIKSRPWHVWALWAIGVVVLLGMLELDPGLIVYLADPELLAGVLLLMAFQVRRSLRGFWEVLTYVAHRSLVGLPQLGTRTEVGLRLYAVSLQARVARG